MVACLEEIAYVWGWISQAELQRRAEQMSNNAYGAYLRQLLEK